MLRLKRMTKLVAVDTILPRLGVLLRRLRDPESRSFPQVGFPAGVRIISLHQRVGRTSNTSANGRAARSLQTRDEPRLRNQAIGASYQQGPDKRLDGPGAFQLSTVHQPARRGIEGVTAVHSATIVPPNQIADLPLLRPSEFFLGRVHCPTTAAGNDHR